MIDFTKVPTDSMYADSTLFNNAHKYVLFPNQLPEIYVEKTGDNWYFSLESTSKINELYNKTYPWHTEKLKK